MKELYVSIVTAVFNDGTYKVQAFNNRQDAEDEANLIELEESNCIVDIHDKYLMI